MLHMAYLTLIYILLTFTGDRCKSRSLQKFGVGDQFEVLSNAIYDSLSPNMTFSENFYSILENMCQMPVYCVNNTMFNDQGLKNVHDIPERNSVELNDIDKAKSTVRAYASRLLGCCQKCSCKKSCVLNDNCCTMYNKTSENPQVSASRNTQDIKSSCQYAGLSAYIHDDYNRGDMFGNSYYMVIECPLYQEEEELKRKCEEPNVQFYDEVIPVYSSYANRIYRNRYCAKCNGIMSYKPWTFSVNLISIFSLTGSVRIPSTPEEIYRISIRNSKSFVLTFKPPSDLISNVIEHFCIFEWQMAVHKCVHNENQNYYLERACNFSEFKFHMLARSYRNVFCYICQEPLLLMETEQTCSPMVKIQPVALTFLLSFPDKGPSSQVDTTKGTCKCNEHFDKINGTCRRLYCPPGSLFADCECISFVSNLTGLTIRVYLDICPRATQQITHTSEQYATLGNTEFSSKLKKHVNALFQSRWRPVQLMGILLVRAETNSTGSIIAYHYVFDIKFLQQSDIRHVIDKVYRTLQSGVIIKVMNIDFYVTLGWIFNLIEYHFGDIPGDDDDPDLVLEEMYRHSLFDPRRVQLAHAQVLSKLITCKRVQLQEEEIPTLMNISGSFGYPVNKLGYIYLDDDKTMCLEDFKVIFNRNTSSKKIIHHCMVFIFWVFTYT